MDNLCLTPQRTHESSCIEHLEINVHKYFGVVYNRLVGTPTPFSRKKINLGLDIKESYFFFLEIASSIAIQSSYSQCILPNILGCFFSFKSTAQKHLINVCTGKDTNLCFIAVQTFFLRYI